MSSFLGNPPIACLGVPQSAWDELYGWGSARRMLTIKTTPQPLFLARCDYFTETRIILLAIEERVLPYCAKLYSLNSLLWPTRRSVGYKGGVIVAGSDLDRGQGGQHMTFFCVLLDLVPRCMNKDEDAFKTSERRSRLDKARSPTSANRKSASISTATTATTIHLDTAIYWGPINASRYEQSPRR